MTASASIEGKPVQPLIALENVGKVFLTEELETHALAGIDLAYDAIRIHYAAYWAAEEGRRITL